MRRGHRWAVGAAAVAVPILAGASPAAAATASDSTRATVTFTATDGSTISCGIAAAHSVNTTTGDLDAGFATSRSECRGLIQIAVQYVDDDGERRQVESISRGAVSADVVVHDAGSTDVATHSSVTFDDCESNCTHTLETKTK